MKPAKSPPHKAGRPRWILHVQAQFWRFLMGIGMYLHRLAPPRPPKPNFSRTIPCTVSPRPGTMVLHFYVPPKYPSPWKANQKRYPVVVNFHGGGFTLGKAKDDARWCKTVVDELSAVCVSVDYRLAPEHPFPTAVEDGVDAILYLAHHAEELNIDLDKIAVSGFSSGANMSFTVPLRLQEEMLSELTPSSDSDSTTTSMMQKAISRGRTLVAVQQEVRLRAIVAWYPPTDYTVTRAQRRQTCARADQELPAIFTELFDESYLSPPTMDMSNPYLSPGVAPDYMLAGLPDDIILFCCEWDMLLAEGERFRDRLVNQLKKNVIYQMVLGVPHGWDKAPNPIKPTPGVKEYYLRACGELRKIFNSEDS
ncbi:hypothetical protein K402DRAFT_412200 [Aulographum hederae CBS 113979]|uniref:Alpha/beta hydrolase fold-3 domain-containing protein n=1 Tax=Aulographum hederae CBS 113979 TaxID=1176131 RepID=A0A6G1H1V0_9PEZI|nr:hypothetical protein K402DRAFT_412200 [Aulographum hederae CBS 113979]